MSDNVRSIVILDDASENSFSLKVEGHWRVHDVLGALIRAQRIVELEMFKAMEEGRNGGREAGGEADGGGWVGGGGGRDN